MTFIYFPALRCYHAAMKPRMTERQLRFTANYLKTVPLAALALFLPRMGDVHGLRGCLALAADCVWQGSVWPLYLFVLIFGKG
jgi:hypothetical protein